MEGNSSNPITIKVNPDGQGQFPNCFFNSSWENSISMDQTDPFESTLSSMVSSPVATAIGAGGGDNCMIKELIGRLGVICNSGEISPQSCLEHTLTNNSTNTSSYATPLNSPPKLSLSMMDHQIRGNFLMGGIQFPPLSQQSFVPFSTDSGFAERAARFSCFGNKNFTSGFSGHISSYGNQTVAVENAKISYRDGNSSHGEAGESREESSLTDQIPGREMNNNANTRKRKSAQRRRAKDAAIPPMESVVSGENNQLSPKKMKLDEATEKGSAAKGSDEHADKVVESEKNQKPSKDNNLKTAEPPKDYIHVRARRGQATDSHSLAERVRREKISQRMKVLQDLVPGCNKVTGKAVMLDEIINYVQSLQYQVEILSMKLATLNPSMDFNVEALLSKDIFQSRESFAHLVFPMNSSSAPSFPTNFQPSHGKDTTNSEVLFPENPLNTAIHGNPGIHFPHMDGFPGAPPQVPSTWEDDLQSVVQMGISRSNRPLSFHGSTDPNHSQMKVEL